MHTNELKATAVKAIGFSVSMLVEIYAQCMYVIAFY